MHSPFALTVSANLDEDLKRLFDEAFPNECCGALFGSVGRDGDWHIDKAVGLTNCFGGDRTKAFAIAPQELSQAVRRERTYDLVGFFHSHPRGSHRPSIKDIAEAGPWPGYIQAIIASIDGKGPKPFFYFATADLWQPVPIRELILDD
ncbi:Mov34/MPN/PAD-1 family protein [Erythrobacter crassostreae]|uniref:Mov34/MPN/PAD-1 family protein n=1 Tax=Erythrobacter crassostreae TaxID=2828328 RepID=A0A9X1JLM1_9SPHN|nr:Mov34/MPN/PAD-1 family protein [Erythrobacter crassostrea]MBV7260305.1 Mov34/MPN/PAD-1 family protein [Erythrobacter crassostrea]